MTGPKTPWHDDELSAEEIRQLRRKHIVRRTLWIGVPSILIAVVVFVLAIPPVKDWRSRQFAERAQTLLQEGNLQEALNNASSAVQVRPRLPEARRAYAHVLIAAGAPEGLQALHEMAEDGIADSRDRMELARAALHFGQIPLAEQQAENLLQQGQNTADALIILARVRLAQQRLADALQALEEARQAGGGPESSILLAQLQFAIGTPESTQSAVDLLTPLARQQDEAGLAALLALVNSPALGTGEGAGWVEALRIHPLAGDDQKLLAASAEIARRPASHSTVVQRMLSDYRDTPVDRRLLLARWLNQQREYEKVLDVITPDEALQRSDLFLVRLDALAGRGDWAAVAELLRRDNLPLQSPIILLYRGRAARELGEQESSGAFYRRSVIEAARTPDVLWYVISYLQRVGEDGVLEQELLRLTENPAVARQAFEALVPIVQKRQNAEELYQLYDRMLRRLPAELVVQNDHRYFAALTGRPPDVGGARELADSEPRMLAYRITLALALLRAAQPEAALLVFDGISLDPAQIQPYQRAVLAAVLGANGRTDEARQLAQSVPGDAVTVSEFELIRPWRSDR